MCRDQRIRVCGGVLAIAFVFLAGYAILVWRNAARLNSTIASGNIIVQAIEGFHQDQGLYPSMLDSLVPGYLHVVPKSAIGNGKWFYEVNSDRTEYTLGFEDGGSVSEPIGFYRSSMREWQIDTK